MHCFLIQPHFDETTFYGPVWILVLKNTSLLTLFLAMGSKQRVLKEVLKSVPMPTIWAKNFHTKGDHKKTLAFSAKV
jgi:hypothetical protein